MKSKTKWLTLMVTLATVFVLVLSLGLSSVFAWAEDDETLATNDGTAGRFYTEYQSKDAAYAATEDMNLSLEEEGIVMLKNDDDTLPLNSGAKVSVFGIAQDSIVESDGTIGDSLRNAGFKVNDVLEEFYLEDDAGDSSAGNETMPGSREISSISRFNDVGIVVFQRGGAGESGSVSSSTSEAEDDEYLGVEQGWTHEALSSSTAMEKYGDEESYYYADATTYYKHALELTESEEDIIALAEQTCKEVVVLYAGEHVFEMANMQSDDNIGGILWIGRPGNGGMDAVGEVLSGAVNPSGKVVDEWTRDLTNDPTFANVSSSTYYNEVTVAAGETQDALGTSTGLSGLDYEEDIYLGYKWYETYWKEATDQSSSGSKTADPKIWSGSEYVDASWNGKTGADAWYDYNMVYPFGYGLSYTDFSFDLKSLETDTGVDASSLSAENIYTSTYQSGAKSLVATVDVTNTGDVAGREVVEVYVEAPYGNSTVDNTGSNNEATGIEKPYLTLAGYAKTDVIKPGKTKTVTVEMDLQDIASFDYDDANNDGKLGYTLDKGTYTVHVMESSSHLNIENEQTADKTNAYEAGTFALSSTVVLDRDTFSGNEVETWFSGSQGSDDAWKADYDSLLLANESGSMTLLSRSDFDGTKPAAPVAGTYTTEEPVYEQTYNEETGEYEDDTSKPVYVQDTDEEGNLLYDNNGGPVYKKDAQGNKIQQTKTVTRYCEENQVELSAATVAMIESYNVWDADTDSDAGQPWEVTDLSLLSGWTQGTGVDTDGDGLYDELVLDDMAGVSMDSPLWVTFMNQLTWEEIQDLLSCGFHITQEVSTIGKVQTRDDNGPNYVNNAPTMVGAPTRSATWNTELAYQSGVVNGNAALAQNMTGWYGPGINMHRSPFGGRTTEYFSQDSIQGGLFASAMVKGMTDCGVNVYLKHLALYDGSAGASTCVNASEQNMRENYLKIFQICMQEGHATATMTSYNRIAAFHPAGDYALIEGLLRSEWGWTGYCLTDNTSDGISADWLVRGGHNLFDGTWGDATGISGTWDKSYDWTTGVQNENTNFASAAATLGNNAPKGAVIVGEGESSIASATQWYCARIAAQRILYNAANSAANNNGITVQDAATYTIDVTLTQGETAADISVLREGIAERGYTLTGVDITDGALPEGLSIENGELSGKPYAVAGSYSVLMTVYVDGWVQLETQLNIQIVSAFEMESDLSSVSKDESIDNYVWLTEDAEHMDSFDGKTITYAVADGILPTGLQLDEATGRITGEPIVSGDYTFTISATVAGEGWVVNFSDYQWSVYQMQLAMGGTDKGYDDINVFIDALYAGEVTVGTTPGEEYFGVYGETYWPAEDETYYFTYTISVLSDSASSGSGSTGSGSTGSGSTGTGSVDAAESASSGNGLAITGLVLGIVAIVLAAAVLVIVLLRRNNGGSSSDDKGSSD